MSVSLPSGTVMIGEDGVYPEEGPTKKVSVEAFEIDRTEVTNKEFREFVEATGYVTRAERGLDENVAPGLPAAFYAPGSIVFSPPEALDVMEPSVWWRFTPGASWRHPYGPGSTIEGKDRYPVVHVTYEDSVAYTNWKGRRLPTEAEWEYAATGGVHSKTAAPSANFWQGLFPIIDTGDDGFKGIAPVGCFEPNEYGLYDMVGNVWELTSSVYYPSHEAERFRAEFPSGHDPNQRGVPVHVIKGGSYLCAENYCFRYRPQSRQPQDAYLATSHVGFRTARDVSIR
ncbi:formylglycine-generating enzyme family protein [Hyphococcus luteus]|uniref:Sulfatase-modifying factor enzyme-like domain-containing protein n=1 Tax=Hyphococcus luteus TaxID=2058213 RepID=A0A2S7K2E4_9PROT|nr:formylglycine-generating enzyme family protein [Marinicaulis flavus]PQA86659.1 hypothetical protein CW354_16010 [Marinicaulis flavus]